MPTYEYRCDACGATYELFQKMSDPPLETCDACGSPVRKVLYPVAIHFKGSGFYTTDYGRSGARRAGSGAEGEGAKGAGESAGGESDGTAAKTGESGRGESAGAGATTAAKGDGAASGASSAGGTADGARKKEKQPAG